MPTRPRSRYGRTVTLPTLDTTVLYPGGATASEGTVLHVQETAGGLAAVVLDRTAFHPVDSHWPDQPADRGVLVLSDGSHVVVAGAVVGATDGQSLLVGADVPVRTGTEGWVFVVVHLVPGGTSIAAGDRVRVEVDADYRRALSVGHTACHLASLALDRVLADAWSKPVAVDALGAPAFDSLAIEASEIVERGSRDRYRIGRSLRKKGFDATRFDEPVALAAAVDEVLAAWTASAAPVRVEVPDAALGARRSWVCALGEGDARIPCGGTHVRSLAELGRVSVSFEVVDADGARTVVMSTSTEAGATGIVDDAADRAGHSHQEP